LNFLALHPYVNYRFANAYNSYDAYNDLTHMKLPAVYRRSRSMNGLVERDAGQQRPNRLIGLLMGLKERIVEQPWDGVT
jgi:hypothetical protein